jgi:hypothetical protein
MKNKWWIEGIIAAVFIIISIIMIILGVLNLGSNGVKIYVVQFIIGAVALLVGLCVALFAIRYKHTHCNVCGQPYNYEKDVSWEVVGGSLKEDSAGAVNANTKIHCHCSCSHCGAVKDFDHTFRTGSVNSNGNSAWAKTPERVVKEYFKAK